MQNKDVILPTNLVISKYIKQMIRGIKCRYLPQKDTKFNFCVLRYNYGTKGGFF